MNYDQLFKLLLVGDSGVGKSNLILRYTDNSFTENHGITLGVDFKIKTIRNADGRVIKLQIWDTAGQERFKAIVTSYYRNSNGVVFVYDCTNQATFDNIATWLESVNRHLGDKVSKVLVGTKCDLTTRKVVDSAMAEEFAKQWGMAFFEASAKNNTNVDDIFKTLTVDMLRQWDVGYAQWKANGQVDASPTVLTEEKKKFGCCFLF